MICLFKDLFSKGGKLSDLKEQIAFYYFSAVAFILFEDVML